MLFTLSIISVWSDWGGRAAAAAGDRGPVCRHGRRQCGAEPILGDGHQVLLPRRPLRGAGHEVLLSRGCSNGILCSPAEPILIYCAYFVSADRKECGYATSWKEATGWGNILPSMSLPVFWYDRMRNFKGSLWLFEQILLWSTEMGIRIISVVSMPIFLFHCLLQR